VDLVVVRIIFIELKYFTRNSNQTLFVFLKTARYGKFVP
jgi:hypothetical protein